ncbi:hypothetical protein [Desulfuromonas acetoxidans]|uniref:hypothetical protein n=1 Tax=Desulfuromonas acetoxidans TaxID=891 RepID=UPI002930BFA2|nr:hypothetical protein [Desulfuromonas acetoxidans]
MTPTERRIELLKAKTRPAQIARALHISPTGVYRVIDDQVTSDRIQRAIAEAINMPVEKVFPDKYPAHGPGPRVEPLPHRAAS